MQKPIQEPNQKSILSRVPSQIFTTPNREDSTTPWEGKVDTNPYRRQVIHQLNEVAILLNNLTISPSTKRKASLKDEDSNKKYKL